MKIRIVIADDHALIRECLYAILEESADVEIVGQAENGLEALNLARVLHPDVVVMDISMKVLDGIEATRRIAAECPGVKVLMLSMHAEKQYVSAAFNAGCNGFLLKSCISAEIAEAIRTVAGNGSFLSEELRPQGGTAGHRSVQPQREDVHLTQREREVLVMLVEGRKLKEIAALLEISPKTAETHRSNLMKKLRINNLADLTKYAIRRGLVAA